MVVLVMVIVTKPVFMMIIIVMRFISVSSMVIASLARIIFCSLVGFIIVSAIVMSVIVDNRQPRHAKLIFLTLVLHFCNL